MPTKKSAKKSAKPSKTKQPQPPSVRVLDEKTSALAIAEYLAIEKVETAELDFIEPEAPTRGCSPREIALVFRVSEVLDIAPCFAMAPRFRTAFVRAQAVISAIKEAQS